MTLFRKILYKMGFFRKYKAIFNKTYIVIDLKDNRVYNPVRITSGLYKGYIILYESVSLNFDDSIRYVANIFDRRGKEIEFMNNPYLVSIIGDIAVDILSVIGEKSEDDVEVYEQ